ncbi:PRC-barrel domain-containing protein [Paracoccus sp. 1_MG-2023]|uniref:PRC-barrel domain-containing protein n=1 Tax=unclassified Paracoccus (in: a-proteobacteria) TaxID=2688777 RepID=UPI001C0A4434|nr:MULTISPECIES: PRC-barrel domain-containing protein [unclassified Paracoccus (in: a-proteobacteria)]MBU2958708.1 PRC-barrel domain-containing protein [Paracoccus sp. C2R09]MDO6667701.1 PRC-barrel domain-containing protein [Paracoccus sp. 1_MG-2023]
MRNILMTTALVLPLGFGAAYAQDSTATEPMNDDAMTQTEPMATDPSNDPAGEDAMAADAEVDASEAEEQAAAAEAANMVEVEQAMNELRVDWITGTTVTSPEGDDIGDINDLIIDGDTGEMKAAVIGVGGFLGIGEKQIALPWTDLTVNSDAQEITATLTQEQADAAPEYVFRDQAATEAETTDAMSGGDAADPMAAQPMEGETEAMEDPGAAPMEGADMEPEMDTEANMEEAESDMTGNDPNAPETTTPAN